MKKAVILVMALALVFSLVGCATVKPQASDKPADVSAAVSEEPGSNESTAPEVSVPAGAPSDPSSSYNAYIQVKGEAYDRISKKLEDNEELYMSVGMSLFTVGMVDLTLIPLTVVSLGEGSETALEMLGITDVKITGSGNDYTVTYSDTENGTVTMTCKYDPATDSVQSTIKDGTGKEIMFFEYVKTGGGYASQYFMDNGEDGLMLVTSFVNDKDIAAFGIKTADSQPASIFGNTSLTKDFVVNDEAYFILEGDSLTLLENGEAKTY